VRFEAIAGFCMGDVINLVRRGFYLDSVGLMQMSRRVRELDGVVDAALMMGTPANHEILETAGLLAAEGRAARPADLIVAIKAADGTCAASALAAAEALLDAPKAAAVTGAADLPPPRTLRAALKRRPDANLALISVPGAFAAAEALKALRRGLHVMIFSDNVPIERELRLKREGRERGLLVMGPDCGTAIINGVALAFANRLPRGPVGIVGASGTGIQEVSCLIARAGSGISHALGTGGRDLRDEIGGITTLMAIDALDGDPATQTIVLISKPPSAAVAGAVMARVARSAKRFVVCFLGMNGLAGPGNAVFASTLKAAALAAIGAEAARLGAVPEPVAARRKRISGLFVGGTLCAEAQLVLLAAGQPVASNVPVPGAADLIGEGHRLIDLGDDEFTRGRPHPMLEPTVRDAPLAEALADPAVGVVLLDLVIGYGGHRDPAATLASVIAQAPADRPLIVASVTGTDEDPQGFERQSASLRAAGVLVAPSNADAAALAVRCVEAAA